MKRELKFRYYDVVTLKMYDVFSFCNEYVKIINGNVVKKIAREDGYIMQYTGLTDKNGKEIYEGGVLKCNHPEEYNYFIGHVVYDEELACFCLKNKYKEVTELPLMNFDSFEVIGNIYENKNLIFDQV